MLKIHQTFPRYQAHDPAVPVWQLTPNRRGCFHRFFDSSPISPSGRYVAVLQMPDESRLNRPGESANVVLIDLHTGEDRVVAATCGWEPQLGANLNWGCDDHVLVFNDVDTSSWTPMLVRLDPLTGQRQQTPGSVFNVSPDGRFAVAPSLEKMRRTQFGYGVLLPDDHVPINVGTPDDDGLFVTDIETGERRLVLSLAQAAQVITYWEDRPVQDWRSYGFLCKWSPDGTRLLLGVRRGLSEAMHPWDNNALPGVLRFDVVTCLADGSELRNALPAPCWLNGGHHTHWFPDGTKLSANLGCFDDTMRLAQVNVDGSELGPVFQDVVGTGHPTVHPSGCVLTDTYFFEKPFARDDGTTPLRWIDMQTGREQHPVRFKSRIDGCDELALRVDPHPAWDASWRYVVFNAVTDNSRSVFLADMAALLD